MKIFLLSVFFLGMAPFVMSQTNPVITSWLQNNTAMGSYYVSGNSTPVSNNILYNCQRVEYNTNFVYVTTTGIPAYPTGPYVNSTISATSRNAIYRLPLNPTPNTSGSLDATRPSNIGIFINGVSLFDFRDGVAWDPSTNDLCGGAGMASCPPGTGTYMDWNRDAVVAERDAFDCSKGHPNQPGNYHHHQNPSAFKLDKNVVSTVCNLYDADGLYMIDSTQHSPLIGFAYDGYPIYGAYGYADTNGTGGITRMKSGYSLRNITVRTHHADGTDVDDGPAVSTTYPLGYFREDYEYIANSAPDYLDEHNGRFCVTPEYPNGTYAYFCTVDANWNSAYPYAVGPFFYGNYQNREVTTIPTGTTVYLDTLTSTNAVASLEELNFKVFPNPASDLIALQVGGLVKQDIEVELINVLGQSVRQTILRQGQTLAHFDVETLYAGTYFIRMRSGEAIITRQVVIQKQ